MKGLTIMTPKGASLKMALQPCPFCGGEAKLFYNCLTLPYVCSCLSCRAEGPCSEKDVGAVELWNRRCELPNPPLTLAELQEMDGKPVWVVSQDGRNESCWMLVDVEYELCREAHGGMAVFENNGKTWLAYRRKQEEVKNRG